MVVSYSRATWFRSPSLTAWERPFIHEVTIPTLSSCSKGRPEAEPLSQSQGTEAQQRTLAALGTVEGNEAHAFQSGRVATISVAHFVHDTYTAFLPPLLPAFVTKLTLSKTDAGVLSLFLQWPSLLQPVIGYLADRVSLRYLVILAPAVTATMMSLLGVAPRYAVLALFLIVTGLSSAAFHAVGPVMAGRLSGRSLGRGMGFWMVGGELGRTVGPIVVVSAVNILTLEGTPWLMAGGLLASLTLYVLLRNVPGRPTQTSQKISLRSGLRGARPLLVPLAAVVVARAVTLPAVTTYLPMFLTEEGINLWFAGVSLSLLEGAGVVGALVAGSLSDRLGRRLVLFIALFCTALFMFAFLATGGWIRVMMMLILGFFALSTTPVIMALVQESFPENRALANGIYMSSSFTTRSLAVLAVGVLGDLFGLRFAFSISAFMPLLGLPFVLLLPREQSDRH